MYLRRGNSFSDETYDELGRIFVDTIEFAEALFGERCFYLYRRYSRKGTDSWSWRETPSITVYDPLMLVLSRLLPYKSSMVPVAKKIQKEIEDLYKTEHSKFEGRNVNTSALKQREELYRKFFNKYI